LGRALAQAEYMSADEQPLEVSISVGGGLRPVGLSVSHLPDVKGAPRGQIVLFKDLTKTKEIERANRDKERMAAVGELARDLAHEIRNPLATVRGCVEMMRVTSTAAEETTAYFDLALREADRLNSLLRDFLTFARLELPRKGTYDLAASIREGLATHSLSVPVLDRLPQRLMASYDPDQMVLVVDALFMTLAEWSEHAAEVVVGATSQNPPRVRFEIKNVCLQDAVREKAFQPFSGVQKAANGLALATAMRIVHGHGGSLTLDIEDNRDTVFQLEIAHHA
jgi:two-component system, NtrC family, sensor histidine kinase PilS